MSGIHFKMEQRIIQKLKKAGATSLKLAVTIGQAKMDLVEESWLPYFLGDYLGQIQKTGDNRYYIGALSHY